MDISEGGMIVPIVEGVIDTKLGARIDLSVMPVYPSIALFSETPSRGIFSFDKEFLDTLKMIAEHYGLKFRVIGEVIDKDELVIEGLPEGSLVLSKEELRKAFYSKPF